MLSIISENLFTANVSLPTPRPSAGMVIRLIGLRGRAPTVVLSTRLGAPHRETACNREQVPANPTISEQPSLSNPKAIITIIPRHFTDILARPHLADDAADSAHTTRVARRVRLPAAVSLTVGLPANRAAENKLWPNLHAL